MASTIEHWLKDGSLADIERAYSLGRVQLVAGDRKQITTDALYFYRYLPCRLYCVGVEIYVGFGGNFANLFDGLQDAGFVVRHHDGNELRVRTESPANVIGIDQATTIDGNVGDFASDGFEMLAGIQHRVMFDGRTDYVIAGAGQAGDGEIVTFGTAAGENDFRCPTPK